MTALAGLWRFDGRPDASLDCARILAAQALYGPDAEAQWSGSGIALGRRLARLLPEDAFDRQPLEGAAARHVLVADLRLDNRGELAEQLQLPNEQVRHLSDADILLSAFEKWGENCVGRLIGDFAFAVWDHRDRRLFLARDPLGQRPLHYHSGQGFFAFASMPKGLHALPEVAYELDEEVIAEALLSLPPTGTASYFRGIERVLPGHITTITTSGIASRQFWQPAIPTLRLRKPEDYCDALRAQLDQAVKCRLRGAGDVGAELSGGLDSSAVAATAARLLGPSGRRVIAFTAVPRRGYDGPVPRNRFMDEGPYAAETAALYPNMEHVLIRNGGKSPLDVLDRNFYLFDAPTIGICNSVWGDKILESARERKLSILLNGLGGNMGLSYDGMELLAELFRTGRWHRLWQEGSALLGKGGMRWRGVLVQTFGPWCPVGIWVWLHRMVSSRALEPTFYSPINPERVAELNLRARASQQDRDLNYRPWKDSRAMRLSAMRSCDLGYSNKGVLGGWHIDCRDPTSDIRLLEFCLSVPTEQFLQRGVTRSLARRTLADRLPKRVVEETRRGLQAADWHEMLSADRQRIAAEIKRLEACAPAARAIDLARLRRLVEDWPETGWERSEIVSAYRLALAAGLSTGHF